MAAKARKRATSAGLTALVTLAMVWWQPGGVRAAGSPATSCETCHSKRAMEFKGSVHEQADITCVTCHGGDPNDLRATAMSASKGFRGRPSRADIPRFCATCHADRGMMHQYGLDTHQFEDYQTSVHGGRWRQGDTRVAVCTDCHGGHRVLPESNTNSTIYPMNVARTCAPCHADKALMAKYGLPADAYEKYESSVHARVLASGGRQSAPSCATCHGSHTALPPGATDIPNICTRCHVQVKPLVDHSPHAAVISRGHMSCESCHGNHAIKVAAYASLSSACDRCHGAGSPQREVGDEVFALIDRAQADYAYARTKIGELDRAGLAVHDLESQLEDANTSIVMAQRDQHTLSPRAVEEKLVDAEALRPEVEQAARQFSVQLAMRKLSLIGLWFFVGLMVLLLYIKRARTLHES